jgi:hypothetical protein
VLVIRGVLARAPPELLLQLVPELVGGGVCPVLPEPRFDEVADLPLERAVELGLEGFGLEAVDYPRLLDLRVR